MKCHYFEHSLDDRASRVRSRANNHRKDATQHAIIDVLGFLPLIPSVFNYRELEFLTHLEQACAKAVWSKT